MQYCLAEGTLDDWMWRTVERKLEVTASTMDGGHGSPMVREFVPGGGGGGGNGEPKEVKGGGGGSGEKENRRESGGSDIRYWLAPPPAQAVGSRGAGTSSDLEAARGAMAQQRGRGRRSTKATAAAVACGARARPASVLAAAASKGEWGGREAAA